MNNEIISVPDSRQENLKSDLTNHGNIFTSEGSKSSTHYLSDTNKFDVSSEGPSSATLSTTYTGHVL